MPKIKLLYYKNLLDNCFVRFFKDFNDDFIQEAVNAVQTAAEKHIEAHGADIIGTKKSIRDALSRFLWSRAHRRPVIMPVVIEI